MSRSTRDIGRLGAGVAGVALLLLPVAAMALGAPAGTQPATQSCVASASPLSVPMEPQPEVLKGAPYSAVGTTEIVSQEGGKRVTRTNTMRYFRDGLGRTRTEYQLAAIGPFVIDQAQSIVTIIDPIAGKRYVLHPGEKRADVFNLPAKGATQAASNGAIFLGGSFTINGRSSGGTGASPGIGSPGGSTSRATPFGSPSEASGTTSRLQPSSRIRRDRDRDNDREARESVDLVAVPACGTAAARNAKPISIGERRIEGLKVTGSRLEFVLSPHEAGNDQPFTVRTDQWFSPDLGVVVSSTSNDPSIGDSTYRLEQINRAEPDGSLFEVPADYSKYTASP